MRFLREKWLKKRMNIAVNDGDAVRICIALILPIRRIVLLFKGIGELS